MKTARTFLFSAALLLAAGSVLAQAASAPAAPAPGPRGGMGQGMGPGGGQGGGQGGAGQGGMMRGPGSRSGQDDTPGWGLMSRAERQEHRNQMRSMKTEAECRDYIARHHETMSARATEKGMPLRGPKRDACAGLPK